MSASSRSRRDRPLLSVVVAVATVVVCLLFEHWWSYNAMQRVARDWPQSRWWLLRMVAMMAVYVLYAAILLLWGRTRVRRVWGAACAVLAGVYVWGLGELFNSVVWKDGQVTQTSFEVYAWAMLLVTPTLIALAWGVARRQGGRWPIGLVAAPALAAVLRELQLHSGWWEREVVFRVHHHWVVSYAVFLLPAVAAALVCWLLEATAERRTTAGPAPEPAPDMQSSA